MTLGFPFCNAAHIFFALALLVTCKAGPTALASNPEIGLQSRFGDLRWLNL
jgi:hypothetical protein